MNVFLNGRYTTLSRGYFNFKGIPYTREEQIALSIATDNRRRTTINMNEGKLHSGQ